MPVLEVVLVTSKSQIKDARCISGKIILKTDGHISLCTTGFRALVSVYLTFCLSYGEISDLADIAQ